MRLQLFAISSLLISAASARQGYLTAAQLEANLYAIADEGDKGYDIASDMANNNKLDSRTVKVS